jgi:hypothetical protein
MIGHVAQSKGKMMRYVIWSLLLIWLTSCTGLVHKEPIALEITTESLLAPARTLITEQAAIETAVMMASQTQPEISGARVPPHNIQAKQTTLMAALQSRRVDERISSPSRYSSASAVHALYCYSRCADWKEYYDGSTSISIQQIRRLGVLVAIYRAPYTYFLAS